MKTFIMLTIAVLLSVPPTYAMGRRSADNAQKRHDAAAPSTVSGRADANAGVRARGDVPGSAATDYRPAADSMKTGTELDANMRPASDASGSETNR